MNLIYLEHSIRDKVRTVLFFWSHGYGISVSLDQSQGSSAPLEVTTLMGGPMLSKVIDTKTVSTESELDIIFEDLLRKRSPLTEYLNN